MNTHPAGLVLIGGFPREPENGTWEELSSLPGPRSLLEALFVEFCGISLNDMPQTEDEGSRTIADDWQTRVITLGSASAGIRQVERKCIRTTALPVSESVETFGLPGLDLHWEYDLEFSGQFGHTAFRHDRLTARFATVEARQHFEAVWERVFGTKPQFQAE